MKKWINFLVWPVILVPVVYFLTKWSHLPDQVPVHYGLDGQADRFGSRNELAWVVALLTGMSIVLYLVLPRIYKIDPKKTAADNKNRLKGIAFAVVLLMSLITFMVVDSAGKPQINFQLKWIFVAIGAFWCVLGNYMYNIKPNYFAGLRLPWTLNSEDNWRKTHHLAGKLWFAAGIFIILLAFLLPQSWIIGAFMVIIFITIMIPVIYSYRLFAKSRLDDR